MLVQCGWHRLSISASGPKKVLALIELPIHLRSHLHSSCRPNLQEVVFAPSAPVVPWKTPGAGLGSGKVLTRTWTLGSCLCCSWPGGASRASGDFQHQQGKSSTLRRLLFHVRFPVPGSLQPWPKSCMTKMICRLHWTSNISVMASQCLQRRRTTFQASRSLAQSGAKTSEKPRLSLSHLLCLQGVETSVVEVRACSA